MTREKAIEIMKTIKADCYIISTEEDKQAFEMAIKALSQEPTVDVLDKIRAEIDGLYEGMTNYYDNRPWMLKDKVLEVIDKYRKMEKR